MISVNVYIKENINKLGNKVFIAPDIPEKKMNNAIKAFKCEDFYKSILAVFDNTLFGACDEGLVFTGEKMILKKMMTDPVTFLYSEIESSKFIKEEIENKKGKIEVKEYIQITRKNGEKIYINNLVSCDYEYFEEFLTNIISMEDFKEENQLKTIAEMSEEFKKAYLQIIINMTYIDDQKIDEKELAEILLLMTRLELSKESRFELRRYLTEISNENILNIEELILIIKEHSESSHFQSLMISLAKDVINIYFSTK